MKIFCGAFISRRVHSTDPAVDPLDPKPIDRSSCSWIAHQHESASSARSAMKVVLGATTQSLRSLGQRFLSCDGGPRADERRDDAHEQGDAGSDQDIPGPRDAGHITCGTAARERAKERQHGRQLSRKHDQSHRGDAHATCRESRRADRARCQKMPRKKPPSRAAIGERRDRQRDDDDRCPLFCGKSSAPPVSTTPQMSANILPDLERSRIVGRAAGERQIDVVRRRRGERVDRARMRAHRGREDRREEQPDQAGRHLLDDERREDRVRRRERSPADRTPRARGRRCRNSENCTKTTMPLPMIASARRRAGFATRAVAAR